MNSLGISSSHFAFSAYSVQAQPVSPIERVNHIKEKQEDFDAKKSNDKNPLTGEINDEAIISDQAKKMLESEKSDAQNSLTKEDENQSQDAVLTDNSGKTKESEKTPDSQAPKTETQARDELTAEEKQQLTELRNRDTEVKAHEQAHQAAAAGISASAPSYDYETGPDGKKYAVGGEVSISFVEGNSPEENIANAQTMKAAALAPASPSGQDRSVARHADNIIAQNKQELLQEKPQEADGSSTESVDGTNLTNPNKTEETIEVKNNPLTGEITQNIKQTPLTKK